MIPLAAGTEGTAAPSTAAVARVRAGAWGGEADLLPIGKALATTPAPPLVAADTEPAAVAKGAGAGVSVADNGKDFAEGVGGDADRGTVAPPRLPGKTLGGDGFDLDTGEISPNRGGPQTRGRGQGLDFHRKAVIGCKPGRQVLNSVRLIQSSS